MPIDTVSHEDCLYEVVASWTMDMLIDNGQRKKVTAWIGRPYTDQIGSYCPCGLLGLESVHVDVDVMRSAGEDKFQATALAYMLLYQLLLHQAKSHSFYRSGTEHPLTTADFDAAFGRSNRRD